MIRGFKKYKGARDRGSIEWKERMVRVYRNALRRIQVHVCRTVGGSVHHALLYRNERRSKVER